MEKRTTPVESPIEWDCDLDLLSAPLPRYSQLPQPAMRASDAPDDGSTHIHRLSTIKPLGFAINSDSSLGGV
jgi:hypothetical protein